MHKKFTTLVWIVALGLGIYILVSGVSTPTVGVNPDPIKCVSDTVMTVDGTCVNQEH